MGEQKIGETGGQPSGVAAEGAIRQRASQRGLREALADIEAFSTTILGLPLRPYQAEVARAVLAAIDEGGGHALTVLMPRQSGKNQLSAHLEAYLLTRRERRGGSLVKCINGRLIGASTSREPRAYA